VEPNIDEAHRLKFLTHYYNSDLAWQKRGSSAGVVVTYKSNDLKLGAGILNYNRGGVFLRPSSRIL
jgi:hypothetical protein